MQPRNASSVCIFREVVGFNVDQSRLTLLFKSTSSVLQNVLPYIFSFLLCSLEQGIIDKFYFLPPSVPRTHRKGGC